MQAEPSGESDITFLRRFDASPSIVWKALTQAEHIPHWLPERPEAMVQCEQDLRVGGALLWVWGPTGGPQMRVSGQYLAIEAPKLLSHTELFDPDWTGGETQVTTHLSEVAPQTTEMRMIVHYGDAGTRDRALNPMMIEGMTAAYARLAALLPRLFAATRRSDFRILAEGQDKIKVTRSFAAPLAAVRRAHLDAALMKRWMGSPEYPVLDVQMDARIGGGFRVDWKTQDGSTLAVIGQYLDIGETHLRHSEIFEPNWTGGKAEVETLFSEKAGRTTVQVTITYTGTPARDSVFASGMSEGMAGSYDNLETLMAKEMAG